MYLGTRHPFLLKMGAIDTLKAELSHHYKLSVWIFENALYLCLDTALTASNDILCKFISIRVRLGRLG